MDTPAVTVENPKPILARGELMREFAQRLEAAESALELCRDTIDAYRAEVDHLNWRSISALQERIGAWGKEKGWDDNRTFGDDIALMHSELSEALEEYRNLNGERTVYYNNGSPAGPVAVHDLSKFPVNLKPEGVPVELADVVIRILHWAARMSVDMEAVILAKLDYNDTRAHRHGGKAL